MKSKLLALAAVAFFAVGSAQAVNTGDGNINEVFSVIPGDSYDMPFSFVLTDVTTLQATAISRYSDTPNADMNFVRLFYNDSQANVGGFTFANDLTEYLFTDLPAGSYTYHVYGNINETGYSPAELTFTSTAVPEPETYAMLFAGLGVLGFAVRNRKSS